MSLRLVEIFLPPDQAGAAREVLHASPVAGPWYESLADGQLLVRIILEAEDSGTVVDAAARRFACTEGFRLLILPVEAAVPWRPAPDSDRTPPALHAMAAPSRVSREELYAAIRNMSRLSGMFVASVLLSGVVASIGLLRSSPAVVIGAMVIAPLLGPNVALAFAATIGDVRLLRRSLFTNLVGLVLALGLGVTLGRLLPLNPHEPELAARTAVHGSDMVLALASGCAGALALTTGAPVVMVGVMVAVALLPPTITLGIMLGDGRWSLAQGAGLLLVTNIICVNLAAVLTFMGQGIQPRSWWEADRTRRCPRIALFTWLALLALLAATIAVVDRGVS